MHPDGCGHMDGEDRRLFYLFIVKINRGAHLNSIFETFQPKRADLSGRLAHAYIRAHIYMYIERFRC